ncbi:MAG TPA: hypothetical protein VEI96_10575, partial [Thermodesulfovibrionales bacterium]|nr:hypothetical protein [Thermodesulfovibrionales bacterium]
MKKIFLLVALLALSLGANSCGNSASNSVVPAGENPGTASLVQLFPSQSVAQTNSSISLEAKVLDGNGMPVPFTQVTFTNLSLTGTFSPASAKTSSIKTAASTSAVTNGAGIATMRLSSTTSGFVTIEVEVSSGAGLLRDRKTVFFSPQSVSQLTPSLTLDVDDGDGTFDEPADFTMLKNANDNSRLIRATVMNGSFLVSGSQVTFGADRPFKVGTDPAAKCSDGSSVCDLIFPDGNVKTTNNVGQATTTIVVDPTILSNITSVLNITAQSDTGAFNIITLFLKPVTVSTV